MFTPLPKNSEALLREIVASENPVEMLEERFENCSHREDEELRALMRELREAGYINNTRWASGVPYAIELNNSARTYDERKAEYERQLALLGGTTYNINAHASTVITGNISNSTLTISNQINNIENEIEEKGGEDKEELKALLDEVKELIENIESSRQIPKNKGLFTRLSSHLSKHGWFYAEIVALLGSITVNLIQGI